MQQWLLFTTILILLPAGRQLYAQGYVDQDKVATLLNDQEASAEHITKVSWHTYTYTDNTPDDTGARAIFLAHIDALPGYYTDMKPYIIELANRVTGNNFKEGRILFIPDSFPQDYKAYSPFPLWYDEAKLLPKLFIIDKHTQAFGAYESGWLVRWGILSSGKTDNKTPAGRYNFNWKDEYRISNASPPGQTWELRYVFNFQSAWGLHVHQYALPIGKAVSHGCVRVAMADAMWLYDWAHSWEYKDGALNRNGTPVMVINETPKNRPASWISEEGEIKSNVSLPVDMYSIPPGLHSHIDEAPWLSDW